VSSEDAEARKYSPQKQTVGISPLDEVAKGLAQGTISRGRALRLVGAGLISTVLGSIVGSGIAEAAPRCPNSGPGCDAQCRDTGGGTCICVKLTNGKTKCVVPFCGGSRCSRNSQCPNGFVCSKTARRCCNRSGDGICVPKCTTSSSAATAAQSESTGSWNRAA
jgi:hypothetical protein